MPYVFGTLSDPNALLQNDYGSSGGEKNIIHVHSLNYVNKRYYLHLSFGFYPMESSQEQITSTKDSKAILTGRLFRKSDGTKTSASELDIDLIERSEGKALSDNFWGRYILLIIGEEGVTFYRDPQGLAPFYYKQTKYGYIFATDIDTISKQSEEELNINWAYLTSFIMSNHNSTTVTPFIGVNELLPGCATRFSMDHKPLVKQFWNPTTIVSTYIANEEHFQEEIYEKTMGALRSWVQGSQKIAIEISGGLDSSSLLAMLRSSDYKNPIQGINYFNSVYVAANEKEQTHDVYTLYDVPVTYIDTQARLPFSEKSLPAKFDRPSSLLIDASYMRPGIELLGITKEDEIISGQGGDHLFLAPPPLESFLDSFLERGFFASRGVLKDICAYYRMPYAKLLVHSFKSYLLYKRGKNNERDLMAIPENWMRKDFTQESDPTIFKPYYWDDLKNVPPGKAQQILAILSATLYIDRGYNIPGKPVINPLLSQPLVELALSMPTYQTFKEGYNRFHFRKAMARNLKGKFMWRRSKGETSGPLIAGARKNFDFFQETLLGGTFSKKGYIDREILQKSLAEFRSGKTLNSWPITNLYIVELWLSSWEK